MVNWRNTRVPKLEGEDEVTTMFDAALNITYELGFEYCGFIMGSNALYRPNRNIHLNNYPDEWNRIYKAENYFEIDPLVSHCRRDVLPLVWEEKTFSAVPDMWVHVQTQGLSYGWAQSVHDFRGFFSMIRLGRRERPVCAHELYEKAGQVLWICHALHTVVAQTYAKEPVFQCPNKLTNRETEILQWSAMGKTAADIATILCLSERTVGFHISSAMRKLGVTNKIAAVFTAMRHGLF
ncbi:MULTISPECIES: autoinducer binding domain-containing protein [Pseudomonas]|uniref:LuxR family transcriptional regulator n=1 Tax=Pseudomonas gessardii TaxID=78544 RepID=A0A7Y1MSR3_9PSED|nr:MULTISPECIES: autoinducer binding domain-containing protein [Pseudomonas]MBH3421543.1 autoinducer binding domain-containing protein [Pseudomonas gessardii]MRU51984.1 LuxR family transcriptional regulator [Pseudomonas gessardii]NNA97402.1 LuxR family transcriptional regulator [Pseudomonas gessardii]ONH40683.1 LuxR family transcriptional regulator [Pseudomonas gessardii]PHN63321.1 LuxR family transcriptional regulator [Pseudomonas sp. ICMP 8385]